MMRQAPIPVTAPLISMLTEYGSILPMLFIYVMEVEMPKVGKRHFSYTPKGKAAARKHAKKTGRKMTTTRKRRSY
jgi:hypothetical protein